MRELGSQETGSVLQAGERVLALRARAEDREEDPGMRLVARKLDGCERDEADARIAKLEPDDPGKLTLDLVLDASAAAGLRSTGRS